VRGLFGQVTGNEGIVHDSITFLIWCLRAV
jgi:hypothetical protein